MERMTTGSSYQTLASRRDRIDRSARRDQIAEILSASILDGTFSPGSRLSESDICEALGVSRNTLREAFSSLVDRRLVIHELNRGVFVRVPSQDDVREMYQCRRIIEGSALRQPLNAEQLGSIREIVTAATKSAASDDWVSVGAADIDFHSEISALNRSHRIDQFMGTIWNEMRLVFHVMGDPDAFHRPYLDLNRQILEALEAQDDSAEPMLLAYLERAEDQILTAYRNRLPKAAGPGPEDRAG